MTKNIWPVMPIMMIGSSIGSILTLLFGVLTQHLTVVSGSSG